MQQLKEAFFSVKLQPHIFSMILVVLILIVLSIVVYLKVSKQPANRAPVGVAQVAEHYVMGVDNLYRDVTGNKLERPAPYIFTLLTFLVFGNLISLVGVPAVSTSYSVTLTLALVSWMGVYVVGIVYKRWRFWLRFLTNPLELIGQFAPLISLSFRLFGNIIGGSIILYLLYYMTGWIWQMIPVVGEINLLGALIAPVFHAYFDIFSGIVQAYVFTLLTMLYWSLETE